MKLIRKFVLALAIIIGLNHCFCREYYLKTVTERPNPVSEKFQSRVAMWNLLSKYFQADGYITVSFEVFKKNESIRFEIFIQLLQMKVGLPVAVIETNESLKRTVDLEEVYHYQQNVNTSYIFVMDMRLYPTFLEKVTLSSIAWSPQTNIVVLTWIDDLSKIQKVFWHMWKVHGISRIIAIDIKAEHVVAYNCIRDQIKVFNDSDVEKILQYRYPKHGYERYPLKVAMYENRPTAISIPNSNKFRGVEQNLIDTVEHYLNFSVQMCKISYSPNEEDGPILSIVKKVRNREIDIAANMYFIMAHGKRAETAFEYTTPFFTERIHFVVPKAEKKPVWLSMYEVFDTQTLVLTICAFGLFVVLWLCILKFNERRKAHGHIGSATIHILFLLTGHSISVQMRSYSKRLLSICGSAFSIIMVSCFSGDLFRRFSYDDYYRDIMNLKELDKSGLHVRYGSWGLAEVLNNTNDPLLTKFMEKVDHGSDVLFAFNLTNGVPDHAVLTRITRAKYEEARYLIENNGIPLYHRISKPVAVYSMAYIVPRGWAFLKELNLLLSKILEAGLIQKWYYASMFNSSLWIERVKKTSSETTPRAFILSDLRLAWLLLAVGLSISCLVFLIELVWQSRIFRSVRNILLLS